jgi:hypothetical protein
MKKGFRNVALICLLAEEDLMQSAVIVASFAYHTAMRDGILPRKEMPPKRARDREPGDTLPDAVGP